MRCTADAGVETLELSFFLSLKQGISSFEDTRPIDYANFLIRFSTLGTVRPGSFSVFLTDLVGRVQKNL
jgi:hypothetical protein